VFFKHSFYINMPWLAWEFSYSVTLLLPFQKVVTGTIKVMKLVLCTVIALYHDSLVVFITLPVSAIFGERSICIY
jgi:hypothetical protein